FEQHAAGLDHGDPHLGRALALTHARLGRLLCEGLVRENPHPDTAATLDVTRERHTGRFDLPGGQPPAARGLQPEIAEGEPRAAPRQAWPAALHHLSVFDFLRCEHGPGLRRADRLALLFL